MWSIDANYSHTGLILNDSEIWHHVEEGFCTMPVADFLSGGRKFIGTKDITSHLTKSEDFVRGYLKGREGVEYSMMSYLGFGIPFLQKFIDDNRSRGVCSESVAQFYNDCCKLRFNDADFVNPKTLWESL